MRPVKIVNACVHNLLVRKTLIKFDVIVQISFGIIFSKFFCQLFRQYGNQITAVLCTFTTAQFLLYNSFTDIPISKKHCFIGSTISCFLSRSNDAFYFSNSRMILHQISLHGITPFFLKIILNHFLLSYQVF